MVVFTKHLSLIRRRDKQKAVTNGSSELALCHQAQDDVGHICLFLFSFVFENNLIWCCTLASEFPPSEVLQLILILL